LQKPQPHKILAQQNLVLSDNKKFCRKIEIVGNSTFFLKLYKWPGTYRGMYMRFWKIK